MQEPFIFATNNQHKVDEIRAATDGLFPIISLKEAGIHQEIPEPYATLEANAAEKSAVILALTQQNCFSEDTGLLIDALDGEPGVKSARYASEDAEYSSNIQKVLRKMEGQPNRTARFRTIISLRLDGEHHIFEGICEGTILETEKGAGGFGYDPIFVPDGSPKTFAELTMEEKNAFSHRRKATEQLVKFLKDNAGK